MLLNLYVDYILILSVEKISHERLRFRRRFLGALVGAVMSLAIYIPYINAIVSALIGIVTSLAVTVAAFGFRSVRLYVRCAAMLYAASCIYAGINMMLWLVFRPVGITVNNSVVYFNVSPLLLIVSTLVCYCVLMIFRRVTRRNVAAGNDCTVDITYQDKSVHIRAFIDTGNTLRDTISGLPVIVIDSESCRQLLGDKADELINCTGSDGIRGFRLIPYNTVGGCGFVAAFRPDTVMVLKDDEYSFCKAFTAVSNSRFRDGYHAIVGSQIIDEREIINVGKQDKITSAKN